MTVENFQKYLAAGIGGIYVEPVVDASVKNTDGKQTITAYKVGRVDRSEFLSCPSLSSAEAHALALELEASVAYRFTQPDDAGGDHFASKHAASVYTRLLRKVAYGLNKVMPTTVPGFQPIDPDRYGWTILIFEIVPQLETVYDAVQSSHVHAAARDSVVATCRSFTDSLSKLGYACSRVKPDDKAPVSVS